MKRLYYFLLPLIAVPILVLLIWYVAVPTAILHDLIVTSLARSGNDKATITVNSLSKGFFLSIHADSLLLSIDSVPALELTELTGAFAPLQLLEQKLAFSLKGKIGNGTVNGTVHYPLGGMIHVRAADLSALPFLKQFGIPVYGSVHGDITIISDTIKGTFTVPDLFVDDTESIVPLLNTFKTLQGALTIKGNRISFESVSLEGDKGYARLKGAINGNIMNLALELMPDRGRLSTMESMLIGKYIRSPGYYVIPINGPLPGR